MRLLIKGGRVLDPCSRTDAQLDVLIQDGVIARLGFGLHGGADEVIDARGAWVMPGAIDIHVRLGQPGHEHRESIATGTRAAAWGGITAVACMPETDPPADEASVVQEMLAIARREAAVRLYPVGALTVGLEGKQLSAMGELAEAGAVALSDGGRAVMDAAVMRHAMAYGAQLRLPIIVRPLDEHLARGGIMREGEVSFRLGLPGIPAEAESIMVARDLELAHRTGARVHIAHVSAAQSLDFLLRARRRGTKVTAGVTAHHLMLTDEALEAFDPAAKVTPPLGTAGDREALRRALAEGWIDCVASDHSPYAVHEKQVELDQAPFGAVGLETLLPVVLGHLVEDGVLSPLRAVEVVTWGPARVLGLRAGSLAEGMPADVTVFDPARRWVVEPGRLHSRGRSTPFAGREMKGQAVATVVGGRVVMRDGELLV